MTRVGLSRTRPDYSGVTPPFGPGAAYPELCALQGDSADSQSVDPVKAGADTEGPNHVYASWNR